MLQTLAHVLYRRMLSASVILVVVETLSTRWIRDPATVTPLLRRVPERCRIPFWYVAMAVTSGCRTLRG